MHSSNGSFDYLYLRLYYSCDHTIHVHILFTVMQITGEKKNDWIKEETNGKCKQYIHTKHSVDVMLWYLFIKNKTKKNCCFVFIVGPEDECAHLGEIGKWYLEGSIRHT